MTRKHHDRLQNSSGLCVCVYLCTVRVRECVSHSSFTRNYAIALVRSGGGVEGLACMFVSGLVCLACCWLPTLYWAAMPVTCTCTCNWDVIIQILSHQNLWSTALSCHCVTEPHHDDDDDLASYAWECDGWVLSIFLWSRQQSVHSLTACVVYWLLTSKLVCCIYSCLCVCGSDE